MLRMIPEFSVRSTYKLKHHPLGFRGRRSVESNVEKDTGIVRYEIKERVMKISGLSDFQARRTDLEAAKKTVPSVDIVESNGVVLTK